jgi:hypothetical protein
VDSAKYSKDNPVKSIYLCLYAKNVIKGRWKMGERAVSRFEPYARFYFDLVDEDFIIKPV